MDRRDRLLLGGLTLVILLLCAGVYAFEKRHQSQYWSTLEDETQLPIVEPPKPQSSEPPSVSRPAATDNAQGKK